MQHKRQNRIRRNALIPPTPFPERVRREIALEDFSRRNCRREIRARMAIGLPPVRRFARETVQ